MTLEDAMKEDNLIKDLTLSFSKVSRIDRLGFKELIKRTKVESEALDYGSLVDDLIQPDFDFDSKYYVFEGNKPSAMLGELCTALIQHFKDSGEKLTRDNYKDIVLYYIKALGLWKRTKDETLLLNKFSREAFNYVNAVLEKGKRRFVTRILKQEAIETVALLKTHKHTSNFFKKDLLFQQFIEFKYGNFMFRGLLDYIDIDHENKTVTGIDLKTGAGSVSEFSSSFVKYRYYFQAALYKIALQSFIDAQGLEGYTVSPFVFLYCGRYEKQPTFITVTDKWDNAALKGFQTKSGYSYKGLEQLLEEIEWHWTNSVFNMSREQYESEGRILIKDDYIILN